MPEQLGKARFLMVHRILDRLHLTRRVLRAARACQNGERLVTAPALGQPARAFRHRKQQAEEDDRRHRART